MVRKATVIYCPYGVEKPLWADTGYVKEGRKYIYFKSKNSNSSNFLRYELGKVIVLKGWNEHVVRQVEEFRRAEREYWKKREQFEEQLEIELRKQLWQKLEEWGKQNPPPKFYLNVKGDC
jgi:hypothetical protein